MEYIINLIPGKILTEIPVSQGDTSLRRFTFNLKAGAEEITLDGTEAVEFLQSNGSRHLCAIEDGKAILDAYADMTENAGQYRCNLQITESGGGVIHSAVFSLKVEDRA